MTLRRRISPALERPSDLTCSLGGWIGDRLRANEVNWLIPAPAMNPGMISMFAHRNDVTFVNGPGDSRVPVPWAGEFAGKYLLSAVQSLDLTHNPDLDQIVSDFVRDLLLTQGSDGSLGMPLPWDLWGQYHVMLGLLRWYEHAGAAGALAACERAAELMCARYLGRESVIETDHPTDGEKNQAVAHVLALLYEYTGEARYLRLVEGIEAAWAQPSSGNFLENALAGREFHQCPRPRWESLHDVQAIAELYFITGQPHYRVAFEQIWQSIRALDRRVTGGFSSFELATGNRHDPRYIETCGTVAWMALTIDMLRMTAKATAADELELSLFNGILGAQSRDGRLWTYHTPMGGIPIGPAADAAALLGYRFPAYYDLGWQARELYPQLSCCAANGPRGLGCLSEWAIMRAHDSIVINYYGPSTMTLAAPCGTSVSLTQATTYPIDGLIQIEVSPTHNARFAIRLRIPAWSQQTRLWVNGAPQTCTPGTYCEIHRVWSPGDVITLILDMSVRVTAGERDARGLSAVHRGPLLLAYDTRFGPFDPLSVPAPDLASTPRIATCPEGAVLLATFPAAGGDVALCDFASAGESRSSNLAQRPDASGAWQFSRSDGSIIAEQIRLLSDGSIDGYSHPNEASWRYDGTALVFCASNGAPTTRFTLRTQAHGKDILSGRLLLDPTVRHILAKVDLGVSDKTWQFSRHQAEGDTVLHSTIRLLPDGGFDVATHPNETRWGREGDRLVFFAADGTVSTRFTSIRMRNGRVAHAGAFLFDRSIVHVLSEAHLEVSPKVWRFSARRKGQEARQMSDKMRLLPNRALDGYRHANEAAWDHDGRIDKLAFLSIGGTVTTHLSTFHAANGVMRFEGTFVPDASITHVLEEVGPGWSADSTYVAWLPSSL